MRVPVVIWTGGDPTRAIRFGFTDAGATQPLHRPVVGHYAGPRGAAVIIYEYPVAARGIPDLISPDTRHRLRGWLPTWSRQKDFVTPTKPIKDTRGAGRVYRCFQGHHKTEVARFFQEALASKEGGPK